MAQTSLPPEVLTPQCIPASSRVGGRRTGEEEGRGGRGEGIASYKVNFDRRMHAHRLYLYTLTASVSFSEDRVVRR